MNNLYKYFGQNIWEQLKAESSLARRIRLYRVGSYVRIQLEVERQ